MKRWQQRDWYNPEAPLAHATTRKASVTKAFLHFAIQTTHPMKSVRITWLNLTQTSNTEC